MATKGGSARMVQRVGLQRTKELAFTGRLFSAEDALVWGFVNRLVPADRLRADAEDLARQLCFAAAVFPDTRGGRRADSIDAWCDQSGCRRANGLSFIVQVGDDFPGDAVNSFDHCAGSVEMPKADTPVTRATTPSILMR